MRERDGKQANDLLEDFDETSCARLAYFKWNSFNVNIYIQLFLAADGTGEDVMTGGRVCTIVISYAKHLSQTIPVHSNQFCQCYDNVMCMHISL